jgi:hypothetical protein
MPMTTGNVNPSSSVDVRMIKFEDVGVVLDAGVPLVRVVVALLADNSFVVEDDVDDVGDDDTDDIATTGVTVAVATVDDDDALATVVVVVAVGGKVDVGRGVGADVAGTGVGDFVVVGGTGVGGGEGAGVGGSVTGNDDDAICGSICDAHTVKNTQTETGVNRTDCVQIVVGA